MRNRKAKKRKRKMDIHKDKHHEELLSNVYENPELIGLNAASIISKFREGGEGEEECIIGRYHADIVFFYHDEIGTEAGVYNMLVVDVKTGIGISMVSVDLKMRNACVYLLDNKEHYLKRYREKYAPDLGFLKFNFMIVTDEYGEIKTYQPVWFKGDRCLSKNQRK